MYNKYIPELFPNKAIKIFLALCLLFWLTGGFLLSIEGNHALFKWINTNNSLWLDQIMPFITLAGEIGMIALFAIVSIFIIYKYKKTKYIYLTAILCNGVPAIINLLLKNLFQFNRPLHFFEQEPWLHFLANQPRQFHYSFPSGHTEGVFAIMTFLTLLLPSKKQLLAIPFFFIALATGYSRIYLVQHFFQDVLVGSMIGTLFCMATYFVVQQKTSNKETKLG